ncbi:o-succinylbenzoate--CoA ligase [Trabulsiella odontotermitis]|uniref:O-succinylbenzoic acid--CoA ligase n=1 Tax=Trabulsiella odontotermitis TaxID=379893 RepID=A0A0L0GX98_9ENTR|nr:o-succinylbenzoate--CoA ligase [Trabulsiella odontotermitis]KNC93825.1 O-succinylbenzoic acid--CoA ligase [Trabulsiella odontotermitis]
MTFSDWPWRHWRETQGNRPALRLDDTTLNWAELCQRVDSLASGFQQQGVVEGDGVMLRARNSERALLAWLALLQCGARILPVNPKLPAELLASLTPGLTLTFLLDLENGAPSFSLTPLRLIERAGEFSLAWQPQRLASMTLTSGSTGLPKAAVHTCAAHLASAQGVLSLIPFRQAECWLLSLPLFHVSGQGIVWRWLLSGAQLAVSERPLAQALDGCSHASLVPTQLWRLLKENATLSLRAVLLGGAAIPVDLTEQASRQGIATFCGYGLTEFASTVCAKAADGADDVGVPLPGREVRLVDGEVWLRAESMASGYWRDGQLTPLVNEQGWFATRDRGEWRDGRLVIAGRLDNLFFSGGEGVQPEAVERVIARHPQVRQVFVVPMDDAEFGQRPVAVVECESADVLPTLAGWAKDKLAGFQQPCRWLALPEQIKNGGIKISRRALQHWVASQHDA